MDPERVRAVYEHLFAAYGPQHWWPADSAFEVMVGAVLTQNTAWTNVERALQRLAERIPLRAESILELPHAELADALRSAGYFNVKARRLRSFCDGYLEAGGLEGLSALATPHLRRQLLGMHGVGPETADDMLLYAFGRPVFVVDAYTRRVFARLGLIEHETGYETLRAAFEDALGPDADLFNEYHALIVRHGKARCRKRPDCPGCCLRSICPAGGA